MPRKLTMLHIPDQCQLSINADQCWVKILENVTWDWGAPINTPFDCTLIGIGQLFPALIFLITVSDACEKQNNYSHR